MKTIQFLIFILSVQAGLAQTIKSDKLYQSYRSFNEVEDSISHTINLQNTIIYKTCEGHSSFYFIQENLHWTGYFIKTLLIDGLPLPTEIDTLKNGDVVEYKPYNTELLVFNADSIVKMLFQNNITNITQISEDAIRAKLIKKGKRKNEHIIQSLPYSAHDCNGTITIYGQKNVSATYRGALIEAENLHKIPTLRIFYETKHFLLNATKNYQ